MENFDAFKNKKSSENLTKALTEAGVETAAADKEAAERTLIRRIGFRGLTERQSAAEDRSLNLDAVYGKFRENIIDEAEYIAKAYEDYESMLREVSAAQGIEASPCSMDAFLDIVESHEDSIQDGEKGYNPEWSFFRPQGREEKIKAAVESDIVSVLVPAGTTIGFGPGVIQGQTKKDFYRTRPGIGREEAIAQARAQGLGYLLRNESHFKVVGDNELEYHSKPEYSYTVVSKRFEDLMRSESGTVSGPFMVRWQNNYDGEVYDKSLTNYMKLSPDADLVKLDNLEAERAPIMVTVSVRGREMRISESTAEKALSAIGSWIDRNSYASKLVEDVKSTSITLPDGRQVSVLELTNDMLEGSRVEVPEGAEVKKAA